ncbi:MAG: outer membrane protein assembly factor BamD [Pseudomonadota bacterium]|nr:outer membrane protein assembly factor BamD [Pseudomonadota bacterium]
MQTIRILSVVAVLLALVACGDKDEDKVKPPESAEKLYNEALDKFSHHNYKDAVKDFEEVERQHPSSQWATNAQIMSAYSSYQAEDYDTAIGTLQRFVKLYPNNESTPYAYYMIALCYYEQINDVGRDQKITEQSMQALREVIRRFPDSQYARDAKIKLDLTTDHMAGKEMEIGRYYLRHDDYIAAINRFRTVVENYQTTTHVPEALHRLVECYLRLGVTEEAKRYAAVLGANYPASRWYRDSYKLMSKFGGLSVPAAAATDAALAPAADTKQEHAEELSVPPAAKTSWWDHLIP